MNTPTNTPIPRLTTLVRPALLALAVAVAVSSMLTGVLTSCGGAAAVATQASSDTEVTASAAGQERRAPRGLTHVCTRWPEKCQPADPSTEPAELGLVCCGPGWCIAITLNSECGANGEIFWCEHGESIVNEQGLPDVICHD